MFRRVEDSVLDGLAALSALPLSATSSARLVLLVPGAVHDLVVRVAAPALVRGLGLVPLLAAP